MNIAIKLKSVFDWAIMDKPNYDKVMSELEINELIPFISRLMIKKDMMSISLFTREKDKLVSVYLPFNGNGKFVKNYAEYEENKL